MLTLSHSDAYLDRMQWGRPQEETVRDYELLGRVGGEWQKLAAVTDNYQRLRVHPLADVDRPLLEERLQTIDRAFLAGGPRAEPSPDGAPGDVITVSRRLLERYAERFPPTVRQLRSGD